MGLKVIKRFMGTTIRVRPTGKTQRNSPPSVTDELQRNAAAIGKDLSTAARIIWSPLSSYFKAFVETGHAVWERLTRRNEEEVSPAAQQPATRILENGNNCNGTSNANTVDPQTQNGSSGTITINTGNKNKKQKKVKPKEKTKTPEPHWAITLDEIKSKSKAEIALMIFNQMNDHTRFTQNLIPLLEGLSNNIPFETAALCFNSSFPAGKKVSLEQVLNKAKDTLISFLAYKTGDFLLAAQIVELLTNENVETDRSLNEEATNEVLMQKITPVQIEITSQTIDVPTFDTPPQTIRIPQERIGMLSIKDDLRQIKSHQATLGIDETSMNQFLGIDLSTIKDNSEHITSTHNTVELSSRVGFLDILSRLQSGKHLPKLRDNFNLENEYAAFCEYRNSPKRNEVSELINYSSTWNLNSFSARKNIARLLEKYPLGDYDEKTEARINYHARELVRSFIRNVTLLDRHSVKSSHRLIRKVEKINITDLGKLNKTAEFILDLAKSNNWTMAIPSLDKKYDLEIRDENKVYLVVFYDLTNSNYAQVVKAAALPLEAVGRKQDYTDQKEDVEVTPVCALNGILELQSDDEADGIQETKLDSLKELLKIPNLVLCDIYLRDARTLITKRVTFTSPLAKMLA